jgi:hypothetical protein
MVTLSSEKLRVAIRFESTERALGWLYWWGQSMGLVKFKDQNGVQCTHVHFLDKLSDLGINHPDRYQHWTWLIEQHGNPIYK